MEKAGWIAAGWTMIHFLWIGSVLGLVVAYGRSLLAKAPPHVRYAYALAGLVVLAVTPGIIFFHELSLTSPTGKAISTQTARSSGLEFRSALAGESRLGIVPSATPQAHEATPITTSPSHPMASYDWHSLLDSIALQVPWIWLLGTPLNLLGIGVGLAGTNRMRQRCSFLNEGWLVELVTELRVSLNITRQVLLALSDQVTTPILVGIFKPIILLPPALLTGYSTEQIQMLLIHELAHIRRWDGLVNLLQRLVEALFFFQPMIWLVSRWVRVEREHCCDAVVVDYTGNPTAYAETLSQVASISPTVELPSALAAARHPLVGRIAHILEIDNQWISAGVRAWLGVAVLAGLFLVISYLWAPITRCFSSGDIEGNAMISETPNHGLVARLFPNRSAWTREQAPIFAISLHNIGNQRIHLHRSQADWELSVDGIRYRRSQERKAGTYALLPGHEWACLPITLDGNGWATWDPKQRSVRPLVLSLGKHKLCLRTVAIMSDAFHRHQRSFRLVSNTVDFEIGESMEQPLTAPDSSQTADRVTGLENTGIAPAPSDHGQLRSHEVTVRSRTLPFPTQRSLGILSIQRRPTPSATNYFLESRDATGWEYWGLAKGVVAVPSDQRLRLDVRVEGIFRYLSPLTSLEANALDTLTLNGQGERSTEADEVMLAQLRGLTGLRVLALNNFKVTPRALAFLKEFRSLESLSLRQNGRPGGPTDGLLDDAGLKMLSQLASLTSLRLTLTQITDDGLTQLTKLSRLKELDLWSERIEGRGLIHLKQLPELRYLSFWAPAINETGLGHLAGLRSLRTLNLHNLTLTKALAIEPTAFPSLEEASFFGADITVPGLGSLESLGSLKRLSIAWNGRSNWIYLGEAEAAPLLRLPLLEKLELRNLVVTDAGLAKLTALPRLRSLRLPIFSEIEPSMDQALYSDVGLEALSQLGDLEELRCGSLEITELGLSNISKLKRLKFLDLSAPRISNVGLASIASLTALESLILEASRVTFTGLNQLNTLTNLQQVQLAGVQADRVPLDLSHLTRLQEFSVIKRSPKDDPLSTECWRDVDLRWVSALTNLHRLWGIEGIGDRGMRHLANLNSMEWLDIDGSPVTDAGLASLIGMTKLKHLTLCGKITDQGLRNLEGLKSLRYLGIGPKAVVSPEALERLRHALPELEIHYGLAMGGGG